MFTKEFRALLFSIGCLFALQSVDAVEQIHGNNAPEKRLQHAQNDAIEALLIQSQLAISPAVELNLSIFMSDKNGQPLRGQLTIVNTTRANLNSQDHALHYENGVLLVRFTTTEGLLQNRLETLKKLQKILVEV